MLSPPPGHNRPIAQNGSKNEIGSLDLSHVFELMLDGNGVTTTNSLAPGGDGPRMAAKADMVAWICCMPLALELILHGAAVTTPASPHVTTDRPEWQQKPRDELCTFFSRSCTVLLSPPQSVGPHVTTDPSPHCCRRHSQQRHRSQQTHRPV